MKNDEKVLAAASIKRVRGAVSVKTSVKAGYSVQFPKVDGASKDSGY